MSHININDIGKADHINGETIARRVHRNRRRVKKSRQEKLAVENHQLQLKICPIVKPQCGFPIRQKQNSRCKTSTINLKQFIPTGCEYYTFRTNMKRIPQMSMTGKENYSMNSQDNKGNAEFLPYISKEEALLGISNGTLIKGVLRINRFNFRQAFCSNINSKMPDYCIDSVLDRNRALEGDIVVLKMYPEEKGGEKKNQCTVVYILEEVHPRIAAGFVTLLYVNGERLPVFTPRDCRFPRLNLTQINLPNNFFLEHKKYCTVLFIAALKDWRTPKYGIGEITEKLGASLDVNAENKAILLEYGLNVVEFPPEALACLPESYDVTQNEINQRLDMRQECIFTIDPLTARDLDDALHIKDLPNGNYEVGVHIADVTHYLPEGTILDNLVAAKATTVYFVEKVFHMLPKDLCMQCSLLPGRDCLAFSVIWELTPEGIIVSTNFARTVINSCTQMAYEHAQSMIDNEVGENITWPKVCGGFKISDIQERVEKMNSIARQMRKRRFELGAMKVEQTKILFDLNPNGDPLSFSIQQSCEANYLIEEFMLLANISVATKIYQAFPDLAFLRCHEEPIDRMIQQLRNRLELRGMHLNFDSSVDIQNSLNGFKALGPSEHAKYVALNNMLMKPMTQARYFCANNKSYGDFHHYGLSIPIYTHFTSPIRRYADVMVHHLLAASIGLRDKPNWDLDKVGKIAAQCNKMKCNAKRAGEASCQLTLARYIDVNRPFVASAVVVGVTAKCFEVVVLVTGTVVRLFLEELKRQMEVTVNTDLAGDNIKITTWTIVHNATNQLPKGTQTIDLFLVVPVALSWKKKYIKFGADLLHPGTITQF